ncbi:MAG: STAS domain-containing protein [Armatimonadetes bacterium]|nr:STAS domain-containing protein [Armatimonadota bacterium]
MNLRIESARQGNLPVLRVEGEVDIASSPILRRALEALGRRCQRLALDLSGVEHLDSTGVMVITTAAARLQRIGREMTILGASKPVHRVFELLGLQNHLPLRAA